MPGGRIPLHGSVAFDDGAGAPLVRGAGDRGRQRTSRSTTASDRGALDDLCVRLDGMPLAIELAAARVRALSLNEILDSLHDRFKLLTGGARTAVRRQQTLRASVDWSHALLTEPERVLFRRLGGVHGRIRPRRRAEPSPATTDVERYQVLDQLSLLVDKSLVVAENASGSTRYRLLETVRQYAHGEARRVRRIRSRYVPGTATTTPRWQSDWMHRHTITFSGTSSKPSRKSTIFARHSYGVVRTTTSRTRWRWLHRCSRCG